MEIVGESWRPPGPITRDDNVLIVAPAFDWEIVGEFMDGKQKRECAHCGDDATCIRQANCGTELCCSECFAELVGGVIPFVHARMCFRGNSGPVDQDIGSYRTIAVRELEEIKAGN